MKMELFFRKKCTGKKGTAEYFSGRRVVIIIEQPETVRGQQGFSLEGHILTGTGKNHRSTPGKFKTGNGRQGFGLCRELEFRSGEDVVQTEVKFSDRKLIVGPGHGNFDRRGQLFGRHGAGKFFNLFFTPGKTAVRKRSRPLDLRGIIHQVVLNRNPGGDIAALHMMERLQQIIHFFRLHSGIPEIVEICRRHIQVDIHDNPQIRRHQIRKIRSRHCSMA